MNYNIEYNKSIEFICALYKYVANRSHNDILTNKEIKNDAARDMYDFSPSKEIKKWLQYINNDISPFLRNDINLIIAKAGRLLDASIKMVIENNIKSPYELIEYIKKIEDWELVKFTYNEYELDIPYDSEDNVLKKALTDQFDEETALFFLQTKNHSKEYKEKSIKIFENFYDLYYKPFEDKVYNFMEKKLQEHNALFKSNNIEFLNTIGLGDYSNLIDKKEDLKIYTSFYLDLGLFHFNVGDSFVLLYGYTMEQRLDKKINLEKSKNLFKVLSDERRLEIIRITSQRPWYNKELADYFNLSTATLSYHLNLLLDLGILNFEPSINNRYCYTANKENLKTLIDLAVHNMLE